MLPFTRLSPLRLSYTTFTNIQRESIRLASTKKKSNRKLTIGAAVDLNEVKVPDETMRQNLIEYAKGEFNSVKNVKDIDQRKYMIAQGSSQFKAITRTIGLSLPDVYFD
ncbi:unnamed protein product [[Candida] boidinii]|nr:unnamed protein product [[Candida] boidinii]